MVITSVLKGCDMRYCRRDAWLVLRSSGERNWHIREGCHNQGRITFLLWYNPQPAYQAFLEELYLPKR